MKVSNRPDRSGVLILPAALAVAALWFAVALVWDGWTIADGTYQRGRHPGVREQLVSDMVASLAGALGLIGSIAVAAIVFGASVLCVVKTFRHYRELVALDDRQWGRRR